MGRFYPSRVRYQVLAGRQSRQTGFLESTDVRSY